MEGARRDTPRALALATFAAYAWLAPPGMYWLDSSELSAASVELGSPHSTGFPLYCLIGKLVSWLPLGEVAYRFHLLSALAGALAVLAVVRLIDGAGRGDLASLVGGLTGGIVCAVALGFARQATVAEVYAPNAALLAVALACYGRVARGGGARDGLALAFVLGLGLGLHTTFRVLLALPVIALLAVRLYRGARWPLYAPLVALTLGAALHLYLPIRSAAGGAELADWGHPRTIDALVDHVAARAARAGLEGRILSDRPLIIVGDAARFADAVGGWLGPLALLAALGGLTWLAFERRGRWLAAALLLVTVGDAAFSIWVHPIGIDDLQNGLPLTVALAALAGVGVAALARTCGRAAPYAGGALALVLAIGPALHTGPRVAAARDSDVPRAVAEAGLAAMPARGVALVRSDSLAASLMLLQLAEGARPDVAALVRQELADRRKTDAVLARVGLPPVADRHPLAALFGGGRAVGWELDDDAPPPGLSPRADVPLAGLAPADAPVAGDDLARAERRVEQLYGGDGAEDAITRRDRAHVLTTLGRLAVSRRDLPRATALFDRAIEVRPTQAEAWVNRGVVRSLQRDLAGATRDTEHALELEPNRVNALVNAARYRFALGDLEATWRHADRAVALAPDTAAAWTFLGLVAARRGRLDEARPLLRRALALDPAQRDAAAALDVIEGTPPVPR